MGTERRKLVQNQGPDQLLDKVQELERGPEFLVMGPQGPGEQRLPLGDCP